MSLLSASFRASSLDDLGASAYLAAANAAIVFTSQDGLSSGIYRFTNINSEMQMYNLPLQYQFEPLTEKSNVFMMFDMGYSSATSDRSIEDANGSLLNIHNSLQTYVGGIGAGIRYKATEHSYLLFGGEVLYSRLGLRVRPEDDDDINGKVIKDLFDQSFKDNYSYKLLAEYVYHREIHKHKVYTRFNYKLYKTFNEIDLGEILGDVVNDVISLQSQTSVASVTISYETNPLYTHNDMTLTLEPYLKGNYIWGDLATVAQINGYGTLGLAGYWNTPKKSVYISRYFIEPSISKGYGLEGINLSLGFSLDF